MHHTQRCAALLDFAPLRRSQAGFAADAQIADLSAQRRALAERVIAADDNLIEFVYQFLTAFHPLGRPAAGIRNTRPPVAEVVTGGNGGINYLDGFLLARIGDYAAAIVSIETAGKMAR